MTAPLEQLKRWRWGARSTLILGVVASVTANVLHAEDNIVSQTISAWPPLALLLTVELISRIPASSTKMAVGRVATTTVIAGIAAWVSYWHMVGVAARYGETGSSPYLLPLSVDGLIVVASICLVEINRWIRDAAETVQAPAAETVKEEAPKPTAKPKPKRVRARSLTNAERVIAAHEKNPSASHKSLADQLGLAVNTVKTYRPKTLLIHPQDRQPSADQPAKTIKTAPFVADTPEPDQEVNGRQPATV